MWRLLFCLPVAHSSRAVFPPCQEDGEKVERAGMIELRKNLEIASSPHVSSGDSVEVIMRNVVIALLPVCAFAIYAFGTAGALILATATLSCVATEQILCNGPGR